MKCRLAINGVVFLVCSVGVVSLWQGHAEAATITTIDQQQLLDNGSNNSGGSGASAIKGQTFKPTLTSLDAVEMRLWGSAGDSFRMHIRDTDLSGLTGTVLGTSEIVTFSAPGTSVAHFDFSTPVALVPEHSYAFELDAITLVGSGYAVRVGLLNPYTRGDYITGSSVHTVDAWFRLGQHEHESTPEPTALALWSTLGGLGLILARRRRTQVA